MYSNRIVCSYRYVTTQFGFPPPASKAPEHLEAMVSLGFNSVELMAVGPAHLKALTDNRSTFREKTRDARVRIPYLSQLLPGLSDSERKNREASLETFTHACILAEELGAFGIIDYGPLPPVTFPSDISEIDKYDPGILSSAPVKSRLNWFDYWENLIDTYRQACDLAAQHNLTFSLRPTPGGLIANSDAFLYFHDEVGRNNLRFSIDTSNQFAVRDNPILSLIRLHDLVDTIYLSDAIDAENLHLEPGEGVIRWDLFFEALLQFRFRGYLIVDIGGTRSEVTDIDSAYKIGASMIESFLSS